jgi:hypothetical protein
MMVPAPGPSPGRLARTPLSTSAFMAELFSKWTQTSGV